MEKWNNRSPEVANLLNPAFCATLIHQTIQEYGKHSKSGLQISLLYLILPILLHKKTREIINSKTNMVKCLQSYPEILIGFSERAKQLIEYANEGLEFLLSRGIVKIADAKINTANNLPAGKIKQLADKNTEIKDCILKAAHLGRWFSNMKTEESIYIAWGVKP